MPSTLVRGGRVVTAESEYDADVLAVDGRIARIGIDLDRAEADVVVDAYGRWVLPGGVDPHTHMDMPVGDTSTCDDYTSGTIAAVHGGTTSIVDFCIQQHGQAPLDALATWKRKLAAAAPVCDVGFHLAVTDLSQPAWLAELARLPEHGVTSLKLFMAYKGTLGVDDGTIVRTMRIAAANGSLVLVHAENGDAIAVLVADALAAGHVEPVWHGRTRPPITEAEATARAISLAALTGCRLYVVHVSCAEALEPIVRAQAAGLRVHAETCVQYLLLDETALEKPGFEGAKAVFTPPPRAREQQEHLWRALQTHALEVVSTDHCPFRYADQKALGREDFTKIPNGAPGIEHRLVLLHEFGVRTGRLSRARWVELCCTAPARRFGLAPRKGTIAIGSDADLVVFDPERVQKISAATHHSRVDYSLYEGTTVRGAPSAVLVRGTVVVQDGELTAEPPRGVFLHRG
jgi:dihydropyrimidinase